jgi:NADPH-dependent 7-cyano-7-deazaguanine reductase QueF-like protein
VATTTLHTACGGSEQRRFSHGSADVRQLEHVSEVKLQGLPLATIDGIKLNQKAVGSVREFQRSFASHFYFNAFSNSVFGFFARPAPRRFL